MSVLETRGLSASASAASGQHRREHRGRRVGDRRHHRAERRRQDDAVQRDHRLLPPEHGPGDLQGPRRHRPRGARAGRARPGSHVPERRVWSRARRCARTCCHRPVPRGRLLDPRPACSGAPRTLRGRARAEPQGRGHRRPDGPRRTSLDTQVVGLPYGVLKRVEIATVLATDPEVLLLDEPSSGMGPEEAHELGDTLLRAAPGRSGSRSR